MNIKLNNDTYFPEKVDDTFTSNSHDKYSNFVDTISSKPHKNIPTITTAAEIFQESGNPIPTIKYIEATTLKPHSSHTINFNNTLHKKYYSSNIPQTVQRNADGTQSKSTSLLQNKPIWTIFKTKKNSVYS